MICNAVIMGKYCQKGVRYRCISTSQYVRLLRRNRLREFVGNLTRWGYSIRLCPVLWHVYEQCLLSHRNCSEPICGLENHLNTQIHMSWESPGSGVEAVEISSVSLQQESGNLEICDSVFQPTPLYAWIAFHDSVQTTKQHVAQGSMCCRWSPLVTQLSVRLQTAKCFDMVCVPTGRPSSKLIKKGRSLQPSHEQLLTLVQSPHGLQFMMLADIFYIMPEIIYHS